MVVVKTKIEFMRGRRANTEILERMIYPSRCGRFKLEKLLCLLDGRTRWYAMHKYAEKIRTHWHMLVHMKTYRTRNAALRVMEKYRKVLDNEPIITRKSKKRKPKRKR